ncbi:lactase-like protein isoform X1 [Heteronotia binoei]|uniref:lactase-like protein isoform X1 n=1 Tax=Heteronotia binoei TaxID=13085 RepID=UPI00292D2179|nr:lactase-like protein isoform X1 [Heteronotia binoei]
MVVRTGVLRAWWLLGLTLVLTSAEEFSWSRQSPGSFYYSTFPKGFLWGVGSSACQTEGAWDKAGKGPSIWDAFGHQGGKVFMNHTADSACESYYKIKDDIQLLKELKVNHYSFSISWPRLLPTGIKSEKVNQEGLRFYNDTINALLANKIIPFVTLYYWDLPQALQQKYGGWQNISMTRYFKDYADLCFENFGDRVKHWITFNNPWAIAEEGYETGRHAPGMKLGSAGVYKVAHHIIKAHAEVWHSYQKRWRRQQQGQVGISLSSAWGEPIDLSSKAHVEVAERYMQFSLGWFANPLYHGDYPGIMKEYVGRKSAEQGIPSRLPAFTVPEKNYVKGTVDFLGISHFTTYYISQKSYPPPGMSYFTDGNLVELVDPKWPESGSKWLYSVPWGFRRLLNFIKVQYENPLIYVTENGISEKLPCAQLCDGWRIDYLKGYINEMLKAIKDGVNVRGYTAWSLLDKFEWNRGYSERFGLYYVDFQNLNKPRYPKASVHYYKKIIKANGFPNAKEVASWHHQATDICSSSSQLLVTEEQRKTAAKMLRLIHEPLATHMEMVTEIVVPTVFTLCILISAILLLFLLRKHH